MPGGANPGNDAPSAAVLHTPIRSSLGGSRGLVVVVQTPPLRATRVPSSAGGRGTTWFSVDCMRVVSDNEEARVDTITAVARKRL